MAPNVRMDTVDREVDLYHDLEDPFFPVEKEDSPVQVSVAQPIEVDLVSAAVI